MTRLIILDPGGYGLRTPLPALVDPLIIRVGVLRRTVGDTVGKREINENINDRANRHWYLTGTHFERLGLLNAGVTVNAQSKPAGAYNANSFNANTEGTAFRDLDSQWRFTVRVDIADRVVNPAVVEWKSFTPEWIGREIDFINLRRPLGSMRVVRTVARMYKEGNEDKIEWTMTALQGAHLEESMDGLQYLREVRRGVT